MENSYIAIDLKSFFASVECVKRNLDPLTTNLVVADAARTEKTICLAVTPSLKAYGISGRARLFEVVEKVKQINAERISKAPGRKFSGTSSDATELAAHPEYELTYEVAKPHMAHYMEYSTKIYDIYLRYVAPEDIQVYSIDEVFMDVTHYLGIYHMSAEQLAGQMMREILKETGITATAGIGTNLYLCKIAMDILAKHAKADENGLRMASLDERTYRQTLWNHRPLTDFWRVGRGYQKKLEAHGLYTMGDVARCSLGGETDFYNETLLYRLFGVNAELLIDHAWGYEPVTMEQLKSYKPRTNSLSSGQVLQCPYEADKAKIVVREMAEELSYQLLEKNYVTDQIVLTVGYDVENLLDEKRRKAYRGEVTIDHYGRSVPKHAHGTITLEKSTHLSTCIMDATANLFDRIVDSTLLIRRMTLCANHVTDVAETQKKEEYEQLSFFSKDKHDTCEVFDEKKQERLQQAMLSVKKRYGKNAILRGSDFTEGATARMRNGQIGGHQS